MRALLHITEPQALTARPSKSAAAAAAALQPLSPQAFEAVIGPDGDLLAVALRKTARTLLQEPLSDDQLWAMREASTSTNTNTNANGEDSTVDARAAASMGEGTVSSVTEGVSPSGHGGIAESRSYNVQGSKVSSSMSDVPESYQLQGDIPAEQVELESIAVQVDSSDDDSSVGDGDDADDLGSFASGGDRRLMGADHLPLKRKVAVPIMGSRPGLVVAANNCGGLYNHGPHFYMGQANRHAHGRKMLDYGHGHSWGGYGGHGHGYGGWGYGGHGDYHHHNGYEHNHYHGGHHGWGRKLLRTQQAL
jgi:hypothetical protein